jgi:hypothetical protein
VNRRSLVVACWLCPVLWALLALLDWNAEAVRAADGPTVEEGFTSIFNGKDLTGWEGDKSLWKVESGMLVGDSQGIPKNQFLATTKRYGDFELRLQFRLRDGKGNSGVQFRSERDAAEGSTEVSGYQADIGESYWGCLYDEHRRNKVLVHASKALNEKLKPADWNDYTIRAEGDRVTLAINGVTTVEYREEDAAIARSGIIAVQVHSGPPLRIEFRNLRIREL